MAEGFEERFRANYADILRLARARLARERSPISTVTLAHELYLNLQGRQDLRFATPGEFMAYASRAMRSLLVDMARERMAQKRYAELMPLTLGAEVPDLAGTPEQLVALDDALTRLGHGGRTTDACGGDARDHGHGSRGSGARTRRSPNPRSNATGNAPRLSCTRRWECRRERCSRARLARPAAVRG